jgi:hypothetical protein
MKVEIMDNTCVVTKEEGDPRFSGKVYSAGESRLLYHIKLNLNAQGYDLIKKRMYKDGHLVDDTQQYLRTRKPSGAPDKDIYIWNTYWQIRGAEVDFNECGKTTFGVEKNVFKKHEEAL